ncbi:MAG: AraC family transcriptional regulator [Alistipes sp.]|nr:AraC family transcriptional regulator [Alistipes sp.]MBQ6988566.1 AraC family transcriptional regulator [Alistipes sp.]MBR2007097.1 AraC family transcriptional regulator [Alistipes sp.]MBR2629611.1 AraC family transcriptional regulator [Alistipes sp.]
MNIAQSSDIRFHYLIANKADEEYGCTVSVVGSQTISPDEDYPSKEHPPGYLFDPERGRILQEYQLLYIVKGRGEFANQTTSYDIVKGTLVLLRPGVWHSYKPSKNEGWTEYFIGFSGEMADKAIEKLFAEDEQIFNVGLKQEMVDLYQRAIEVAAEDRPSAQQLLCGIVMHLLGNLSYIAHSAITADRMDQIIEQAKAIMQEKASQNIDLDMLAEQLNVSYSWFRKVFREYTGYPPAKYFMLVKLRRAQYLLVNTQESIKEIAFSLGFKSPEHFYTTFKRVMGSTPSIYRKSSTPEK